MVSCGRGLAALVTIGGLYWPLMAAGCRLSRNRGLYWSFVAFRGRQLAALVTPSGL